MVGTLECETNVPFGMNIFPGLGPFGKTDKRTPWKIEGFAQNDQFLLNSIKICDFPKTNKHIVQNKGYTPWNNP